MSVRTGLYDQKLRLVLRHNNDTGSLVPCLLTRGVEFIGVF